MSKKGWARLGFSCLALLVLLGVPGCSGSPAPALPRAGAEQGAKRLRPQDLSQITAVTVTDDTHNRTRSTTDRGKIEPLLEQLKSARYIGDDRAAVTVKGTSYLLILIKDDGSEIPLAYWPGAPSPNIRDLGQREWWEVRGLDERVAPLLPDAH